MSMGIYQVEDTDDGAVLTAGWSDRVASLWEHIKPSYQPTNLQAGETDAASAVHRYSTGDRGDRRRPGATRRHGTSAAVMGTDPSDPTG